MPKIDTYSLDTTLTDNDSLLGINAADGKTKRYAMSAIKTFVASVADIEGVTAGTGLTGGGTSGTVTLAVAAAQTGITSVVNTALEIGRDADNRIKFGTDNQIIFEVDGGDNVIFKTSGEIEATSLDISGDADIDGTLEADAITVNGTALAEVISDTTGAMFTGNTETFITATYEDSDNTIDLVVPVLDEDNMASNSASHLATQQSIKAYVDSQVATADTLAELSDTNIGSLASGHILIYDGSDSFDNKAVSGDITIASTGAVTIANDAVETAMLNDNVVTGQSELSTVANDDVLLIYDTSGSALKKITRSALVAGLATSGAISNVVEDTTPQLGGDLDVNGNGLVSTSNGNIALTPNGTGVVRLDTNVDIESGKISIKNSGSQSYVRFYCEVSNAHYAQLQAPAHSAFSGNVILTLPTTTSNIVGDTATQTITNKTIDVDNNTVSNIEVDNLKSGVLDTDISSVSGSDDTLASAKAIKTYVDAQIQTEDTLVELNDTNITSPAAGHILIYDNTAGVFDNATITAGSGISVTNGDGAITIANTAAGDNAFGTIAVSGQTNVVADSVNDTLTLAAGTGIAITTTPGTDTVTITNNATGANAFGNIAVSGQTTVAADSTNDTLTLAAGSNVTLTTDASSDTVTIAASAGANTIDVNEYTGNGSTAAYTLNTSASSENELLVYMDGVYQHHNTYSVSGTTLTFDTNVPNGSKVEAFHMRSVNLSNVVTSAVAGEGIDVSASTGAVTISAEDATTSNKGIASFSSDNFAVSSGAVTIKDGGIVTAELAADAVTGDKIADDAINSEHYTDGSIDNAHIADNQISYEKIDDEFSTVDTLSAGATVAVDFDAAQVFTLTPNQNTTLNITNPKIGITKTIIMTGAGSSYTLAFQVGGSSGTFNKIAGDYDDTSSKKNFIQITCVAATEFWYSISQIAS
tara:strand:- start:735 stop:3524 length:2790 start_codon:yes stop_codon:yes gene_type:complete